MSIVEPKGNLFARFKLAHGAGDQIRVGRGLAAEFDLEDALATAFDLLDRNQRLPDVLVGLTEVVLQLADAVAEQADVFYQPADLVTDLVGGLTHTSVALALPHQLDSEHQQRRRHDNDLGAKR